MFSREEVATSQYVSRKKEMTALNNTDHAADNEALVANCARKYVKIVYGSVPDRTSLDETIQKGGVAKQLEAAWSLIEIYAERVSRALETSGGRGVAYEDDDLKGDCDATIEVLNDLIRALNRDKNALREIIVDLNFEKIKASYPYDFIVKLDSSGEGQKNIIADVEKAYAAEKDAGNDVYVAIDGSFNTPNDSAKYKADHALKYECCDSLEEFINLIRNLTPEGDDYYALRVTICRR